MLIDTSNFLDFYPRPPRGGRHWLSSLSARRWRISIHALREEGDPSKSSVPSALCDFYPRPPRGGRQDGRILRIDASVFLSTPSARRATGFSFWCEGGDLFLSTPSARRATFPNRFLLDFFRISIHALREEGDRLLYGQVALCEQFLSTPSARRATPIALWMSDSASISIHALREEGDPGLHRGCKPCSHISIHALREEGDLSGQSGNLVLSISIHALREEGDAQL